MAGYETKPKLLTIENYANIMKLQSESTLNVVSFFVNGECQQWKLDSKLLAEQTVTERACSRSVRESRVRDSAEGAGFGQNG